MQMTSWLFVLVTIWNVEPNPGLIAIPSSRRRDLFFRKSIKDDTQRDFVSDRLKTIQQKTVEDHVKRRAKDSHVIKRQLETVPVLTGVNKRPTDSPSSLDMLVIPPPLPKHAELREMEIISSSDVCKKRKDTKSRRKQRKTIDTKKVQSRKTRQRRRKYDSKKRRAADGDVYRLLKALNAMTAEPVSTNQDRIMSGRIRSRRLRADEPTTVEPNNEKRKDEKDEVFRKFSQQTGSLVMYRPRSRSFFTKPFTKPALWEPNPDNPHNRDHPNVWWYNPRSVKADWLSGQIHWNGHWGVPAAGVGGTQGFSAVVFPSVGRFLNIPDDYD